MRKYELMAVLKATLSESERKDVVLKLKKLVEETKGKVDDVSELGERELAYEIKKEASGFYILLKLMLDPENIYAFGQKIKIEESVLRHLLVRED